MCSYQSHSTRMHSAPTTQPDNWGNLSRQFYCRCWSSQQRYPALTTYRLRERQRVHPLTQQPVASRRHSGAQPAGQLAPEKRGLHGCRSRLRGGPQQPRQPWVYPPPPPAPVEHPQYGAPLLSWGLNYVGDRLSLTSFPRLMGVRRK